MDKPGGGSLGPGVSTEHQKCSREFVVEGAFPREQGPENARENRHSQQDEVNGIPDPLEPARKNQKQDGRRPSPQDAGPAEHPPAGGFHAVAGHHGDSEAPEDQSSAGCHSGCKRENPNGAQLKNELFPCASKKHVSGGEYLGERLPLWGAEFLDLGFGSGAFRLGALGAAGMDFRG